MHLETSMHLQIVMFCYGALKHSISFIQEGASSGAPQAIGSEYSRWMLLDRFHFTETGLECDKIGVGYEAFQKQPNFCWSSFGSCLNNQLWNFLEVII